MDSPTQNTPAFKGASLPSSLKPKSQENGNDDTEISVFDAHKYFNETKDIKADVSVPRMSSVDGYCRNFWTKSFRSTPTPSSEISCNSQTGLLPNPQHPHKNFPLDCINKKWYAAKKWLFTRKCCCRGKKSVQVKESTSDLKHEKPVLLINANSTCQEREQSFPETDNIVEIHHVKSMAALSFAETDFSSIDAPRQQRISASGKSFIDGAVGFTFPILNPSSDLSKQVINSLTFSTSDPIPREDDVGSDASSDLFEIDSLSTQTTSYPIYRRRDSVDHDQSEVSIDVNAAAAELESAANLAISAEVGGEGKMQSNRLILMSCRKEAVSMKCVADGPPMLPLHVGGRPPPPLSVGSSYSAGRLSQAFAACEIGVSQASWW